jgi:hypothetical protein
MNLNLPSQPSASASGPSCTCSNHQFHDRDDDSWITSPAIVALHSRHGRRPQSPPGHARKSPRTITAPPEQTHQNSQIPITSQRCPAGSCLGGFRTPALVPNARPGRAGIRKPSPSWSPEGYHAIPKAVTHQRKWALHSGRAFRGPIGLHKGGTSLQERPAARPFCATNPPCCM